MSMLHAEAEAWLPFGLRTDCSRNEALFLYHPDASTEEI